MAVIRDAPAGMETLFLLRPVEAEFVPRAQVFPGGRIDDADAGPEWDRLTDVSEAEAARMLHAEEAGGQPARAFLVGAVREVFEETGVLLGVDGEGAGGREWLQAARLKVHSGAASFASVVSEAGLRLDLRSLVPFTRWVTPEALPKRYDTFFLAAGMPANHEAVAAPGEIASLEWVTPGGALARADSRDAYILPPTRAALTALSAYTDVRSALEGLGRDADLAPILPRVVGAATGIGQQGIRVLMPGEPGYEEQP